MIAPRLARMAWGSAVARDVVVAPSSTFEGDAEDDEPRSKNVATPARPAAARMHRRCGEGRQSRHEHLARAHLHYPSGGREVSSRCAFFDLSSSLT